MQGVSQRALLRASEGEAHGCAFQRRKDARSRHQLLFVENVGKTEGNRSK